MQYIELIQGLKNFTVFSLSDIRALDAGFHRRRLTDWQKKGYIKKVVRGYYIFSDLELNENVLFEIANRIYKPSYISFETAFSYYELIPESTYGITSASTQRTYKLKTQIAEFSYRTLTPHLFFGYDIIKYGNKCFKMACIEKALLDYFYINPRLNGREAFFGLRINRDVLFEKVNKRMLDRLLKKFSQKKLTERVNYFWEVMKNA